jgi:aminoglycoside phosphotransferase (APT) family kinase protein
VHESLLICLSSCRHERRASSEAVIDDALLPAAAFLTGPAAFDVIGAAVTATAGRLVCCESVQVQYRPATDLVVRYRAKIEGPDGNIETATLLAATTIHGAPAGTVPVEAELHDRVLTVGVWKWPFDPVLTALTEAVTPHRAAVLFADVLEAPIDLEVVVYRPTERAVIRAVDRNGRRVFIKVVAPSTTTSLLERHRRLAAAGLPVPSVLAADESAGWFALAEIEGPTLRELMKDESATLPAVDQLVNLRRRLADSPPGATVSGRRARTVDAPAHAAMLGAVLPEQQVRLARLAEHFTTLVPASTARAGALVHGDLHEAQLIVVDGAITGLLDVDDAGIGDPVDDIATLLGHLRYRALTTPAPQAAARLHAYTDELREAMVAEVASSGLDATIIDSATAAVLVGLATGPFRIQMDGWREVVHQLLALVDELLGTRTAADEASGGHADANTTTEDATEDATDEKDLSLAS